MIAKFKKKIVSNFPVILIFFVLIIDVKVYAKDNENATVPTINDQNSTHPIQPMKLINHLVPEKKDQSKPKQTNHISREIEDNEIVTLTDTSQVSFPYNLKVIKDVLERLGNEGCVKDTVEVLMAMTNHEKWALEMFDSFPKFPVGILYGNFYQLGNFDECIGAKQTHKDEYDTGNLIQGQYCLTDIHFKQKGAKLRNSSSKMSNFKPNRNHFNKTVIHWGICLPSSCTRKDAEIFTKAVFSSAVDNLDVTAVVIEQNRCTYEKKMPITYSEIIYGAVVGCFLIFIALCTGLHIWYLRQRKRSTAYNVDALRAENSGIVRELTKCFSVIHTTGKFLHTKPHELNLECICGIKFLSMMLIVVGHSLLFIIGGPLENKNFLTTENVQLKNGVFFNNPLLVDTFLLTSGFLLSRLLLLEMEKRKGKVNFLILYIARYIRLTPAYLIVIGFHMTFFPRIGSGPFWESRVGLEQERCTSSWWTNILYINNYVNNGYLCMFQSWYLSADYHLFIIAPFIIYPLWRWRRIGEILLLICSAVTIAVPFWLTYRDNLDPTLLAFAPELKDVTTNFYFLNVYIKTHMRAGSYCIGLLFGYLVHRIQTNGIKIPSYIVYLGWTLSSCLAIISMFSIVIFFNPDHIDNNIENAIYSSLHRIAWCIAIGWIIVTCITENAAMVNKFLSWKPFIPLSRLTYCAYLVNGLVEVYNMGVLRQPTYLSKYELACKLLGHLCITFFLAFILCICFESPIHGLEKILLSKERKVKEQRQNSTMRPLEDA